MAQIAARRAAVRGAALAAGAGLLWLGFSAAADPATIRGTARANALYGTKAHDVLYGRPGNDRLYGGGGKDTLYGGPGNDTLVGGPGRDTISCGAGRDVVYADRRDRIDAGCEVVLGRAVKHLVPGPKPVPTTTRVST